jgi:hypothetical protein
VHFNIAPIGTITSIPFNQQDWCRCSDLSVLFFILLKQIMTR